MSTVTRSSLVLALALAEAAGAAEPESATAAPSATAPSSALLWASRGAETLRQGRWQLALFGQSHYGLADGVELALQPLVFLVLPHAEAKLRLLQRGAFTLSLRPRLSYPSPFLNLVSKEGTGGLLPATSDVPFALLFESDLVASERYATEHVASASLGLAFAPRGSSGEFPLLDFPFLYPRFAALYGVVVPRAAVSAEGRAVERLFYSVELTAFLLPLREFDGYALEPAIELQYRFGPRVALLAGVRASIARYPVGTRFHSLPYLDVELGF
jgi:hypothetical protein